MLMQPQYNIMDIPTFYRNEKQDGGSSQAVPSSCSKGAVIYHCTSAFFLQVIDLHGISLY
jgi:hypothetical protein